jgi:multiple sugar transport system permease protein
MEKTVFTEPLPDSLAAAPRANLPARRIAGRNIRLAQSVVRYGLLSVVSLAFLLPFYWMTISALKDDEEVFAQPIEWFPAEPQWNNFIDVLDYPGFPFWRFMLNSTFYASVVTIGTVLSCAAAGYGFARLRFPGRDLLFMLTVACLMIPGIVTFIPTFILFRSLGILGSWWPLLLPAFCGSPFFIFMMRQFYIGIPQELSDAARVDGAGEFRIFAQIMLPLVRPALLVMAVFTFLWTWHDFFGPLVYLSNRDMYPLSLGLHSFRSQHDTDWNMMMAAATISTLPLIVIFFLAQRYFLEGVRLTGIKG